MDDDNEVLTIRKSMLTEALLKWELAYRAGECRSPEESLALPAEQVAAENSEHLWKDLAMKATT